MQDGQPTPLERIEDSFINGQFTQAKEQFFDLETNDKLDVVIAMTEGTEQGAGMVGIESHKLRFLRTLLISLYE